jgi:hypothetical protein
MPESKETTPVNSPTGNPFPLKPQPVPAITRSVGGRYVLVAPSGTNDWWMVNDLKEGYAVVTVQARHPLSQKAAEAAFELFASGDEK